MKAIDRQHYYFGHVFERVEQDGSGVHVHFANGRSERADLLVGCDGFRSNVRGCLAPEAQPIYSGYFIWRGAPNESDLSPQTRETMFPYYSFFLGDQLQGRPSRKHRFGNACSAVTRLMARKPRSALHDVGARRDKMSLC